MEIAWALALSALPLSASTPLDGLSALYATWHGQGSWAPTNWLQATGPCSTAAPWDGVVCNNSLVVDLDLRDRELASTLPSEVSSCSPTRSPQAAPCSLQLIDLTPPRHAHVAPSAPGPLCRWGC